jgi:Tfp pilus assembly ATPase PilU
MILKDLIVEKRGLILVVGRPAPVNPHAGSYDDRNNTRGGHIPTIEDRSNWVRAQP